MATHLSTSSLSATKMASMVVLLPRGMDEATTTSQTGPKGLLQAATTVKHHMHLAH